MKIAKLNLKKGKVFFILFVLFGLGLWFTGIIFARPDVASEGLRKRMHGDTEGIVRAEDKGIEEFGLFGAKPEQPEFAPSQLIVKLKPGTALADIAALNAKYKVISSGKVFKDTPTPQDALKQLKDKLISLNTEHDKWYWQLDKDSQECQDYIGKINKEKESLKQHIQAREALLAKQEQAPKENLPDLSNVHLLKTEDKETDVLAMARDYSSNASIAYAQPNYIRKALMVPNDPYYSSRGSWGQDYDDLWGIKKIQADKAWDLTQGEGVVVAVIDTGVDYKHPDFKNNIWTNQKEISGNGIDDDGNGYIDDVRGWDFAYNDNDPMDGRGHGTHCAGTIAAVGNNAIGVIGVAPKAKIMPLKGLDDFGYGSDSGLANCVKYAVDNGANILSNSWGGQGESLLLTDAFHYAYTKGCVAIAAAGNVNMDTQYFTPANIDTVITVSASNQNDEKCSFSNYGAKIDVSAPGGDSYSGDGPDGPTTWKLGRNILSLRAAGTDMSRIDDLGRSLPEGICLVPQFDQSAQYYRAKGTSMACPHVSGVAALILAQNPSLAPQEVRNIVQSSADDIGDPGKDNKFGYGRLNAYKALRVTEGEAKAEIISPIKDFIKGIISISGSAFSNTDFQKYELYYVPLDNLQNATLINSSNQPVENKRLGVWNTSACPDGKYMLILKVIGSQATYTFSQYVTIDNYNQAPEFVNLVNKGAIVDRLLEFKVEAQDPDDPSTPWGQLTYSATNLPSGAKFDSQTQIFSWTPNELNKGIQEATFAVKDSRYTVTKSIIIPTLYIKETQITTNLQDQEYPAIYEDKIIWGDNRNSEPASDISNFDLYMYDFATKKETQITNAPGDQLCSFIYEDKIVWTDYRNSMPGYYNNADLYMYDLTTQAETPISVNPAHQIYQSIYQDKIVWEDWRNNDRMHNIPNSDIYMYDLTTGRETQITTNSKNQQSPAIYQDRIVWLDDRNGNYDLYMYDLATNAETQITTDPKDQYKPAIYQDRIVWMDWRNRNWDIYMYDLKAKTETQITTDPNDQFLPVIYQDKIVYTDRRNGNDDIYLYDLLTRSEIQITNDLKPQFEPAIYQDRIAWCDNRNLDEDSPQNGDIYLAKVTFPPYITAVSPVEVRLGSEVTITGNNFGVTQGDSKVEFNDGTAVPVESWLDTKIICRPRQAKEGLLRVRTKGGISNGVLVKVIGSPPTPIVRDEGIFTFDSKRLTASWFSQDSSSGIAEYQYKITQDSPSGATIVDWTSTGKINFVVKSGLYLIPNKAYFFLVKAKNGAGLWSEVGVSDGIRYRDIIRPQVSFISPNEGSILKGTVNIQAQATDNIAISKVAFYINGDLKFTATTLPYAYSWNTTVHCDGKHKIKVIAYDTSNNSASKEINVTLQQPPGQRLRFVNAVSSSRANVNPAIDGNLASACRMGPGYFYITADLGGSYALTKFRVIISENYKCRATLSAGGNIIFPASQSKSGTYLIYEFNLNNLTGAYRYITVALWNYDFYNRYINVNELEAYGRPK